MNTLPQRLFAASLILSLSLPSPVFALRESQEDSTVKLLERRLRPAVGLEEPQGKTRSKAYNREETGVSLSEILAELRRQNLLQFKIFANYDDRRLLLVSGPGLQTVATDTQELLVDELRRILPDQADQVTYAFKTQKIKGSNGVVAEVTPNIPIEIFGSDDMATIVPLVLEAVAFAVQTKGRQKMAGRHFVPIQMKDGAVLLTNQGTASILRGRRSSKTGIPLGHFFLDPMARSRFIHLSRAALAPQPPEEPATRALWDSPAAGRLRESRVWAVTVRGARTNSELLLGDVIDLDSALLVLGLINELMEARKPVPMDVVWSAFDLFHEFALGSGSAEAFLRYLKILDRYFPETDPHGSNGQAARVWEKAYPVLLESLDIPSGDPLDLFFQKAAQQIPKTVPAPSPWAVTFSPGSVLHNVDSPALRETVRAYEILRKLLAPSGKPAPPDFARALKTFRETGLYSEPENWVRAFLSLLRQSPEKADPIPPLLLSDPPYRAGPFAPGQISLEARGHYFSEEWLPSLERVFTAVADQVGTPDRPITADQLGLPFLQDLMTALSRARDEQGQLLIHDDQETEVYRWAYREFPRLFVPRLAPEGIDSGLLRQAAENPFRLTNDAGNNAVAEALARLVAEPDGPFQEDAAPLQANPPERLIPWIKLVLALNLIDYSRSSILEEIRQEGDLVAYVLNRLETPFLEPLGGEQHLVSFVGRILEPNTVLVHLPDNNAELAGSLKLAEVLLTASPTLQIRMIVKADNGAMNDGSLADADRLLERYPNLYSRLLEYRAQKRFRLIAGAAMHGTPLHLLPALALRALEEAHLVFAEGEANAWNLNGLNKAIYFGLRLKWPTGVQRMFGLGLPKEVAAQRPPAFFLIDGSRGRYYDNPYDVAGLPPRRTIAQTLAAQSAGLEERVLFDEPIGVRDAEGLEPDLYKKNPLEIARGKASRALYEGVQKKQTALFKKLRNEIPYLADPLDPAIVRNLQDRLPSDGTIRLLRPDHTIRILAVVALLRHILVNAVDSVVARWEPALDPFEIRLRAFIRGSDLFIQVLDNGAGFPEEAFSRIGLPGYSTRPESAGFAGHTGYGVFFSNAIAIGMGWDLDFENRPDPRGAQVTLRIPLPAGLEEPISRREVLQRFLAGLMTANVDLGKLVEKTSGGPPALAATKPSKTAAKRLLGINRVDVAGYLADAEANAPYFYDRGVRSIWAQETPHLAQAVRAKEGEELDTVLKLSRTVAQKVPGLVQQLNDPSGRAGLLDSVRSAEPVAFQGLSDDQLATAVGSALREEAGQIQTLVQAWIPRAREMLAALSDGLLNASTASEFDPDLPTPPAEPTESISGTGSTNPPRPLAPQPLLRSEPPFKPADDQIRETLSWLKFGDRPSRRALLAIERWLTVPPLPREVLTAEVFGSWLENAGTAYRTWQGMLRIAGETQTDLYAVPEIQEILVDLVDTADEARRGYASLREEVPANSDLSEQVESLSAGAGLILSRLNHSLRSNALIGTAAGLEEPVAIPVQGRAVSPEEAGITEQQYVAELQAYIKSLPPITAATADRGPLADENVRHILFFYPYALYTGGAAVVQRNMIEALLRSHRGLTIDLLYLNFEQARSEQQLEDPARNNHVVLHGIPTQQITGVSLTPAERTKLLQEILSKIHTAQPIDLLVNNNSTPQMEMMRGLWDFTREGKIPFFTYFHGGLLTEGAKYLVEHSDGAATNSRAFQTVFEKLGVRVPVLYPIPDLSFFLEPLSQKEAAATEKLLGEHGLSGKRIILHPARLYPLKGQEDTIFAAKIFQAQHPELADSFSFVILGPPRNIGEEARLRALARREGAAVTFVRKQNREQMRLWYHAAHVVLYPTRGEEPFGLVAVEAQASGAPVIVTNVGGLQETLTDGVTGLVVPKADPAQMAQAVYRLADPSTHNRMAAAALDYAQKEYSPQQTLKHFEAAYLGTVRARREKDESSAGAIPPAFPANPRQVLFDLYATTYATGQAATDENGGELVDRLKKAWEEVREKSRSHWRTDPAFPFAYSKTAPFIAYDPSLIPARPVGPFMRLELPSMPDRDAYSVTRENPTSKSGESNLLHELRLPPLMEDPLNPNFVLIANHFPKVTYDSMLVSRDWQKQRLTREAVRAELQWARRGLVSDFHHTEGFVDHLHIHLYPAIQAPVFSFVDSFIPESKWGGVAIGETGYPVPHVALASSDDTALEKAVLSFLDQLEKENLWFTQTVLPPLRSNEVVVLFHIMTKDPQPFGFSPVGFLKLSSGNWSDAQLLHEVQNRFMDVPATAQLHASFWRDWKTTPDTGLEEHETDWTLYWNNPNYVTAEGSDPQVLQQEPWRGFFEALRAVRPHAKILEIGSGNLALSKLAKETGPDFDLHAIDKADIRPERIKSSEGIRFRRERIERTGYPDEDFDAVDGRFALEYSETALSFPELNRILRPGGRGVFLLHHRDSGAVRIARLVTVDNGVLPAALDAYQKLRLYLQNRDEQTARNYSNAVDQLETYRGAPEAIVQQQAQTALDNLQGFLAMTHDEFQAPLELLGQHIREAQFYVDVHRNVVKAALSPEDITEWAHRLHQAGLVVDRFEPFYEESALIGWHLELHKPKTGLRETPEKLFVGSISAKDVPGLAAFYRTYPLETAREKAVDAIRFAATKIQGDLFNRLSDEIPSLDRIVHGQTVRAVRVELTGDPWIADMVEGDANEIEYLFGLLRHVVANAADSVVLQWEPEFKSPEIQLLAFVQNGSLIIQVLDNGAGFSPEVLRQLGTPKFTTREKTQGLSGRFGSGVFFSTVIAKQLGWDLDFENRPDTRGAQITLRIPLPAAGLEEAAQKFKETYTVRRAENPAQFVTMIDTLDHVQDRDLDRFAQAARIFIPRWKEAAGGDFSRFLKPEERPKMLEQMRRAVRDRAVVVRPGSWVLEPNEEAMVDSLVAQLLSEPVAPHKALYKEYLGGRNLNPSENERLSQYYTNFIHLTILLKYRDYVGAVSTFFEQQRSSWRTAEVREKFIPEALATFLGSYSVLPDGNPKYLASEVKVMDGLTGFLGQARIIKAWPWPKDRASVLPGFAGLVQSKEIRQKFAYDPLDPPSSYPKAKFSEGGAFVSGEGRTPFILYSDGADPEEIQGAQAVLPEMFPELAGLSFYRLPGGFATFRHNGQEFLIGNNHLDTVLNFIPASMTKNGKAKLVVDPLYYREIESSEEFQRFVAEQGDSFDLVLVEDTERHFNPANFAFVFRKGAVRPTLLLNYAPETIAKMGLKPDAYFTLSEENAFRNIALLGGSLGCLCGLDLLKEETAGLEERTARSVQLLRQVPPAVPGSVGEAVFVFRHRRTYDLAALAAQMGARIAVPDDGPEAAGLEELIKALEIPADRYAVGVLQASRFLERFPRQILIDDRPEGFRLLGLRWDDLPAPVAAALESVLAFLDTASAA